MKNEDALDLDLIKKSAYEKSFRELGDDDEIMSIAEEGLQDYVDQIQSFEVFETTKD